jgi:Uncharacterized protein conserved in cyanobacteria
MALAAPKAHLLSYEDYMSEPEIVQRYDIIEGVRHFMPAPTWDHQQILFRVAKLLDGYAEATSLGFAMMAPLDVLIRRTPRLETRQPDVFFVTHQRLAQGGGVPKKGPLPVGPELVVEIVSESERASMLSDKLADYASVGVNEAWIVRPDAQTVEVIALGGTRSSTLFSSSDQLHSFVFPDLKLSVSDFFKP